MDAEFKFYLSLLHKPNNSDKKLPANIYCDICLSELLIDDKLYINICPNCSICYPYYDYFKPVIRSVPYKRKWHFMTSIRKLKFYINSDEIEDMLHHYIKIDHKFTEVYPKKNMVNLMFVIKFLALKLGYDHIAAHIKFPDTSVKTQLKWYEKLNLASS